MICTEGVELAGAEAVDCVPYMANELGQARCVVRRYSLHSARAELLSCAGRENEARHAYLRALELAQTEIERRSLQDRLARPKPSS